MEPHETDYQRARRQRSEVKKHGVTGSTPKDAAKRIKEHSESKSKALEKAKGGKKIKSEASMRKVAHEVNNSRHESGSSDNYRKNFGRG